MLEIINRLGEREVCTKVGYLVKTHGIGGGIVLAFEKGISLDLEGLDVLFILLEGRPVPFFVRELEPRASEDEAVICFEDVEDIDQARALCGNIVCLPHGMLPGQPSTEPGFQQLTGFMVFDALGTCIGEILEIVEYPGNPVFRIRREGKEVLIPVADELIREIIPEEQSIFVDLPEGLLDLYL